MKKIITVLLVGAMIMSVACTKKETTTTTTTATTTKTEETTTEAPDKSDILVGKLKTDPRDLDAGKIELVQPVEPRNIQIASYEKAGEGDSLINNSIVVGEKTVLSVKYSAKEDSKLTIYVLPFSEAFRWNKSEALASATVDVKKSDDGQVDLEFTIPAGTESAKYAFVFVENEDTVVGYFQDVVLTDANDKKPL